MPTKKTAKKKTAKKRAKKPAKKKADLPEQFEHEQSKLFKHTGLSTQHIGKFRDTYVPATDKMYINGSGWFYTHSGAAILLKKFGLKWDDLETKQEWAEVTKLTGNYKRIFCEDVETGEMIRVKVQDSKNFRTGMIVPIINRIGDTATLNRKCPRSHGVW